MNTIDVLKLIAIDFGLFTGEFILFTIYRTFRSKHIPYEYNSSKVPAFPEGEMSLWELLKLTWKIPYSEINTYCGLEGKLYLGLHKNLAWGFLFMSIIGLVFLIPIYAVDESFDNNFSNLNMETIIKEEDRMASVMVFFLVFTVFGILLTISYIKTVSEAYCAEETRSCAIDRYTVQIHGLPRGHPRLIQESVKAFLDFQYPGIVQSVYVVPNLYKAYRAQCALENAQHELKRYKEYFIDTSERKKIKLGKCSKKLDAIEHYRGVEETQRAILEEELEKGKRLCSGIAYVLCHKSSQAFYLIQHFRSKKGVLNSNKWKLSMAPAPAELNWHNLKFVEPKIKCMRILIYLLYILLFFILITPMTMLGGITYLFQGVGFEFGLQYVSDGLLPSMILLLYLSVILRHSVRNLVVKEKRLSKSEETISCMKKYLLLMVIFTFILPLSGINSFDMILDLLNGDFWVLEDNLLDQGLYFMFVVMHLAFLKNAGDFIQLPKYVRVKLRQKKALNEREKALAYEAYEFRWAYEYGISLCSYFIVMAFALIYPLILVMGAFFFLTRYFTAKYNLLCFYHPVKTTTGNRVTRSITAILLTGIVGFQIITCVVVLLHSTYVYIILSGTLLVLSCIGFLFIYVKRKTFEIKFRQLFQTEPNENLQSFISARNIKEYYHPMENRLDSSSLVLMS